MRGLPPRLADVRSYGGSVTTTSRLSSGSSAKRSRQSPCQSLMLAVDLVLVADITCARCVKSFHVPDYRARTAQFCSRGCMTQAPLCRLPPHRPRKRIVLTCKTCQQTFERQSGRPRHGRGVYCSRRCMYEGLAEHRAPRQTMVCVGCGAIFQILACQQRDRRGAGTYCSRACRDENRRGPKHPQYLHGAGAYHRGPNWQRQKRHAKARDGHRCLRCGTREQDLRARGKFLHVHHVVPYRLCSSWKSANRLENLRSLCENCHRVEDAEFQALERDLIADLEKISSSTSVHVAPEDGETLGTRQDGQRSCGAGTP
jgi:5-methylcytosine-specific restriction endonuclease McrA